MFHGDENSLQYELDIKKMQSKEMHKHDLIMSFYLAAHLKKPIVKYLYECDEWLKETINRVIEKYRSLNEEDKYQSLDLSSPKKSVRNKEESKNDQSNVSAINLTQRENLDVSKLLSFSEKGRLDIRHILQSKAGENLSTN